MSDKQYWLTFAGWSALVLGFVVWAYFQVKRQDDAVDANEALRKEMRAFNSAHRPYTDSGIIPLPPADVDREYEAFALDGEHPHPRTPPRAA